MSENRPRRVKAEIVSNEELLSGFHLLWLQAPKLAQAFQPGQFMMVRCGEGFDFTLRRPFSLHQVAEERLALFFKKVGRGTRWLAERQPGDELDLLGPLGRGFSVSPESRHLLLVAGGVGIAPLLFLAQRELLLGRKVTLLLGAKTSSELYPESLLPEGLHLAITTEDGSAGRKGMVTELLPELALAADQIFACGPLPMYQAMAEMNLEKPVQILLEQILGCGIGACQGCSVPTIAGLKRVCREGPVFNLEEVILSQVKSPSG